MKLKLKPVSQTALFLTIFAAFAIAFNFRAEVLAHLGMTVGFALILFGILTLITKKKKEIQNTLITSLIIFLILHPTALEPFEATGIIITLAVTFVAMLIKFFFEYKGSSPINPTVFSLLILWGIISLLPTIPAESLFVSWWGASFRGYISLVLILLWIVFGLYRWRKLPTIITFLVAYAIALYFIGQNFDTFKFIFTDATIYFFSGIMLIDPKTSPFTKNEQIIYGLLAAIVYYTLFHYQIPNFELLTIAAANLYFFVSKVIKLKKVTSAN